MNPSIPIQVVPDVRIEATNTLYDATYGIDTFEPQLCHTLGAVDRYAS